MEQNVSIPTPSLQDAMEALRREYHDAVINLPHFLAGEAADLAAAIEYVLSVADTEHVSPPPLRPDDRQPEDVDDVVLYDGALDALPPRKLADVWDGQGDYDDPLLPEDKHEQELVLTRLRRDPEADWQGGDIKVTTAVLIGADGEPSRRTDANHEPVRGPEYDVDWVAKAEREKGLDDSNTSV